MDASGYQLLLSELQLALLLLVLLDFSLEDFCDGLVGAWVELISQENFLDVLEVHVVGYCWVQVEQ